MKNIDIFYIHYTTTLVCNDDCEDKTNTSQQTVLINKTVEFHK